MSNSNYKIAVVSNNGTTVGQHFGSARFYEVFTVDNGSVQNHEKREKISFHGEGIPNHLHQHSGGGSFQRSRHGGLLSEVTPEFSGGRMMHGFGNNEGRKHHQMLEAISDCDYLIARGMGYGIYSHLENANIKPIITDIRLIEDAIKAVLDGSIVNHHEKLH